MAKKISLDRQTELKKINLKDPDMEKKLREECDSMRDAGYDLKANMAVR